MVLPPRRREAFPAAPVTTFGVSNIDVFAQDSVTLSGPRDLDDRAAHGLDVEPRHRRQADWLAPGRAFRRDQPRRRISRSVPS